MGGSVEPAAAQVRCQGRRQRAPAAPGHLEVLEAGRLALARLSQGPAASMADSVQPAKRGLLRSTWLRARKARTQLVLSRRPRRRLGALRWCSRKRLRRRLLQAQAAGADWREGGSLVWRAAARRSKAAAPSPAAAPTPSGPAVLPIPPVRPAGPGRALLLLPLRQVGRAAESGSGVGGGDAARGWPASEARGPVAVPRGGGPEQLVTRTPLYGSRPSEPKGIVTVIIVKVVAFTGCLEMPGSKYSGCVRFVNPFNTPRPLWNLIPITMNVTDEGTEVA